MPVVVHEYVSRCAFRPDVVHLGESFCSGVSVFLRVNDEVKEWDSDQMHFRNVAGKTGQSYCTLKQYGADLIVSRCIANRHNVLCLSPRL